MPNDQEPLVAALASAADVGVPTYVLIDPLVGEPIAVDSGAADSGEAPGSLGEINSARTLAWGRRVVSVELHPAIDLEPGRHPYLVSLAGPEDSWLLDTLAIAMEEKDDAQSGGLRGTGKAVHRIAGWLQSSADAEQIALAISACLRVRCEMRVKQTYLRLIDRRVLSWATVVAGVARIKAMLGPIQRWTYLNALGSLSALDRTAESPSPLRWSGAQWKTFMQVDLVQQTCARYLGELHRRGSPPPAHEHDLLMQVHTAVGHAETLASKWPDRVVDANDMTALAALLLLHGSAAINSSAFASAVNASSPGGAAGRLHESTPSLNDLLFENRL